MDALAAKVVQALIQRAPQLVVGHSVVNQDVGPGLAPGVDSNGQDGGAKHDQNEESSAEYGAH